MTKVLRGVREEISLKRGFCEIQKFWCKLIQYEPFERFESQQFGALFVQKFRQNRSQFTRGKFCPYVSDNDNDHVFLQ